MDNNIAWNQWLTQNKPLTWDIYLFITPISTLNKMGIKKGLDLVAHWALCINGCVFELGLTGQKKPKYAYRKTSEKDFILFRKSQNKNIMCGNIGSLSCAYSTDQIHAIGKSSGPPLVAQDPSLRKTDTSVIAQMVWSLTLKEKYIYDEYNCQVFIRLLVEIIGDQAARTNLPAFLDKMVKNAQNARDGGSFALAAGATMIAAGLTTWVVDGGATAAAGFAIAAQTTLRASAWLLTERDGRAKKIKEGQKKAKKQMAKDGMQVCHY